MTQSESDLGGQLEKLISTVVMETGKIFRTGWDFLFSPRRFDYATSLARVDREAETRESLYSGPLTYLSVTCLWFTAYLYAAAKIKGNSLEFIEKAIGRFDWKIIFVFLLPFVFCVALYSAVATMTFRVFGKETTFKYQMRLNSYFVGTYALGLMVIGPSYVFIAAATARGQKGDDFVVVYLVIAACVAGLLVPRSIYRYFKILCRATSSNVWLVIIVLVVAGIGFIVAVVVAEILIVPIFGPFLRDEPLGAV